MPDGIEQKPARKHPCICSRADQGVDSSPPSTCVGLAKSGLQRRLFRAEPTLGLGASVATAVGEVINPRIWPCPNRIVALDLAAHWHGRLIREKLVSRIRRAVRPQQLG